MKRIYVGNLSYQTTDDGLRAVFANYGAVRKASVVHDRETGQPRGFGFVEMDNDDEAASAITGLNGTELDGRTLTVNEARPRAEHSGGRSGGRDEHRERGGGGGRRW